MKPHDVLIRTATSTDYSACLPLLASLYHDDIGPCFKEAFQNLATNKNSIVLLAEDSSKAIGILIGSFHLDIDWEANIGRVQAIFTAQNHRRRGIAGRLLDHFIEVSKKKKCRAIGSRVNKRNKDAQSFHESRGFWKADTYEYILDLQEEPKHRP